MAALNPATQNVLPSPIQDLTIREIFLFTRIPLYLLEGFINGKFKPNRSDREKLTIVSLPFYKWNDLERKAFIQRKKYRAIRGFLSLAEKEELFNRPERDKYNQKLDELVEKYWDQILVAEAQR